MLYSANDCKARFFDRMSSVCLSVRLSVTLVDQDHVGWKSWKQIAQTITQVLLKTWIASWPRAPTRTPPLPWRTWLSNKLHVYFYVSFASASVATTMREIWDDWRRTCLGLSACQILDNGLPSTAPKTDRRHWTPAVATWHTVNDMERTPLTVSVLWRHWPKCVVIKEQRPVVLWNCDSSCSAS